MFRGDLRHSVEPLGLFLTELLGGQPVYSFARGRSLGRAHDFDLAELLAHAAACRRVDAVSRLLDAAAARPPARDELGDVEPSVEPGDLKRWFDLAYAYEDTRQLLRERATPE